MIKLMFGVVGVVAVAGVVSVSGVVCVVAAVAVVAVASFRGGSRIFFRRGCTRLLLCFNTNKPHSCFFFAEY